MKYSHNFVQLSLNNFLAIGFDLSTNKLVAISDSIKWEPLVSIVQKCFSNKGRNSKSTRLMIGLEMGKTYYRVSDATILEMLKTDTGLMYLCGFDHPIEDYELPKDPSILTKFRNKLNPQITNQLVDIVTGEIILKLPARKRRVIHSDTTCVDANVTYPTDTSLLHTVSKKLVSVVENIRSNGSDILIRGKNTISKVFKIFNKKRIKSKSEIAKMKKRLIRFNEKLISLIQNSKKDINEKMQSVVIKSKKIIKQQKQILSNALSKTTQSIKNRIVSFHDDKLRPIFRGKAKQPTQFGKKISFIRIGGVLSVPVKNQYKNFSDTTVVTADIQRYKSITGNLPSVYTADKGVHSPKNHKLLKKLGITDGIEFRGKITNRSDLPPDKTRKRLRRAHQSAEGGIGTLKTRYGCEKIPYKSENTAVRLGFACILMNTTWLVNNR